MPDLTLTRMQHHCGTYSRRRFLQTAGAGAAVLATGVRAADGLTATVRNPLLRTPLALLIDDSCPVINLGWHWIKHGASGFCARMGRMVRGAGHSWEVQHGAVSGWYRSH